jgi:hypothetical protein
VTLAPSDGVIVRWRARMVGSAQLVVARYTADDTAFRVAISDPASGSTTASPMEAATRLPIKAGDRIGIALPGPTQILFRDPHTGADTDFWSEAPNNFDTTPKAAGSADGQLTLLFNADLEADADGDGFGDESQDGCPTDPARQGACADVTIPLFYGRASASPASFLVDRSGAAEQPVSGATRGTTFGYRLSEPARVTFRIERRTSGRKVRKRCVRPTRRNRRRKRCVRYVRVGAFAQDGGAGANQKRFSGRIGRRALRPGRYRALLTARDSAGLVSKPATVRFRVLRPKRKRR